MANTNAHLLHFKDASILRLVSSGEESKKLDSSLSKIFVDRDRTIALINKKFGNFDKFIADWEEAANRLPDFPSAKQRASSYAWMSKGVPVRGNRYAILALSCLLDVDPLCIFDFEKNGYFSKFTKIRKIIYLGQAQMGAIGPLFELYRPSDIWPSTSLSKKFYRRDWFRDYLSNKDVWETAGDKLVSVKFVENREAYPRAVHISYRRIKSDDKMWRYYGTVISLDESLFLYSEGGDFQEMKITDDDTISFRTFFGARPVEFCVASLHNFELTLGDIGKNDNTIGFDW